MFIYTGTHTLSNNKVISLALSFENPKEYITELIGTMILVAIGCLFGFRLYSYSMMAAAGFALTFIGLIYCIGKYSNCHFNPLISLSMFISGKMKASDTLFYVLAQIIGGIVGALIAFFTLVIAYDSWDMLINADYYGGYFYDIEGHIEVVGAMIVEFFLAFILSFITMKATDSKKIDMKSGAIIATAMFGLIWIGYNLVGTAVNPAKSIGTAFAMMFSNLEGHFEPLIQLWLFIIFPALGAAVGTFIYMVTESDEFDLNKYLSAIKKKKEEKAADEEYAEESEENAEEPAAEEEPAEAVVEDTEEEIPEIESVEEDALPEVESAEETVVESEEPVADSETKTE